LGNAAKGSSALIHHAPYLFTALRRWLWFLTSRVAKAHIPAFMSHSCSMLDMEFREHPLPDIR
jgi:hypothetical protein